MALRIADYTDYQEEEVLALYAAVGWVNYTARPGMLEQAFRGSLCVLGAWEDGRLVGLLRAVGDGASIVYVQDLLVLPAAQRRGVGRALLEALAQRFGRVYQTVLLTDDRPETLAFYEALGFVRAEALGCRALMKLLPPERT